jgi:hypothetical protein
MPVLGTECGNGFPHESWEFVAMTRASARQHTEQRTAPPSRHTPTHRVVRASVQCRVKISLYDRESSSCMSLVSSAPPMASSTLHTASAQDTLPASETPVQDEVESAAALVSESSATSAGAGAAGTGAAMDTATEARGGSVASERCGGLSS